MVDLYGTHMSIARSWPGATKLTVVARQAARGFLGGLNRKITCSRYYLARSGFGMSDGLRTESNRSPRAGCFLNAHPS